MNSPVSHSNVNDNDTGKIYHSLSNYYGSNIIVSILHVLIKFTFTITL